MATEILRPNANGDTVQFELDYTDTNWEAVDEVEADGETTIVYAGTDDADMDATDLYNMPNHSEGSGTINKIKVYAVCSATADDTTVYAKLAVKTGGEVFLGSAQEVLLDEFGTLSQEWTTNPDTEQAWTWDDIDALQIGINSYATFVVEYAEIILTQVYLEVDYTEAPSGPTTCTFILNHNNLEALEGADSGTYPINNNMVEIAISGTSYVFNPFSKTPNGDGDSYLDMVNGSTITIIVSTE